jgi:hypothetical protein
MDDNVDIMCGISSRENRMHGHACSQTEQNRMESAKTKTKMKMKMKMKMKYQPCHRSAVTSHQSEGEKQKTKMENGRVEGAGRTGQCSAKVTYSSSCTRNKTKRNEIESNKAVCTEPSRVGLGLGCGHGRA